MKLLKELKKEKKNVAGDTKKASFDFRKDLYIKFKEKCRKNGLSLKSVIEKMMEKVINDSV